MKTKNKLIFIGFWSVVLLGLISFAISTSKPLKPNCFKSFIDEIIGMYCIDESMRQLVYLGYFFFTIAIILLGILINKLIINREL